MRFQTAAFALFLTAASFGAEVETGAAIYQRLCAECHGKRGEGVADKYDEPLYGERGIESLAKLIDRTMPEDEPEKLDAAGARAAAEYIHGAFYSLDARIRNNPPKRELTRLTNRQFRESVADLIGSFRPGAPAVEGLGLRGEYYSSKGMNKREKRGFERVDMALNFDFGEGSPGEGIAADQFSINWDGSLIAGETGQYEFRVRTPNGARLYLNGETAEGNRKGRDDSDAKREPPFLDAWVSSGADVREESGKMFLLGGRAYPLRLEYFKYKDRRGSLSIEWKPPGGVWSVLAAPHIVPSRSNRVAVVSATLPPDDGSAGYERGVTISKEWHEATTKAAIEASAEVASHLRRLSGADDGNVEKLKEFAATVAERAFRRPLTSEVRALYVEKQFADGVAPDIAVRRAVLSVLKSPRFLYPELGNLRDDYTVGARLALALWDSLPDPELADAAKRGELRTPDQARAQAERMMRDPRAKAKLADFFHDWLAAGEAGDLTKDPKLFPGFDATIIADLRRSLELFVEDVVWAATSDYRQLLRADYVFVNSRLAKFYGMTPPGEDGFGRVFFDPSQRAGIFTHPFLLSVFSYHKSTSPIHRGVFLTRNVMGRHLKPPPMAVEFKDERFDPSLTMREKITQLTNKASCQSCHTTIDPLGFSLENYDAVGRFRMTENKKPINAAADYTTNEGEVVKLSGARDLAEHTASSAEARRGFVRHLFHYMVKNEPALYGADTLQHLDSTFEQSGTHIRKLAVEIAVTTALDASREETTANR
jgi:Protein of unknown function (DUF1592)/Protein of unknown function (DUF1588)/PA14 domain/Cytochrome C oxidase, cbb3-type, subunit III